MPENKKRVKKKITLNLNKHGFITYVVCLRVSFPCMYVYLYMYFLFEYDISSEKVETVI